MTRGLVDPYHRTIDYLRVSITDLCNLRCTYCRPPEGLQLISHDEILRYEEILTIVGTARNLGIRKIRVTGGEPLVRRGMLGFISNLVNLEGIEDVALTTNGVLLPAMAEGLKSAGLTRINISLDSLNRETFRAVTGSDHLEEVLQGIFEALRLGFEPVKINVVLLEGINEADVAPFARLTLEHPLEVRFIERMPFGVQPVPNPPSSFSARKALDIIRREVGELESLDRRPLDGPATMFRLAGAVGRIGVIDPITGHFCGTCNRLRLTARGTIRPCLLGLHEVDIRGPLRKGASQAELAELIQAAVLAKPVGHSPLSAPLHDTMNMIGG